MSDSSPLVLFDGVCNLCNAWVRWIIAADPSKIFRLAPLQSDAGRAALRGTGLPEDRLETVVLVENGRAFTRSSAALRVARRLAWPWPMLYAFILVPGPLRDLVYDWIARNRYRWFGRREACLVPGPDVKERFLG